MNCSPLRTVALALLLVLALGGCESPVNLGTAHAPAAPSPPTPPPPPEPESPAWLILVFMSADNDLEARAIEDVNEMEAVDADDSYRVVALLDRAVGGDASNGDWTGTRLFQIEPDPAGLDSEIRSPELAVPELGLEPGAAVELDTGDPETLRLLLHHLRRRYEPERAALVVWGHGDGYRSTGHDRSAGGSSLTTSALAAAVRDAGVDLIALDTAMGATVEVALELRDAASLLVASQDRSVAGGWEYDDLLLRLGALGADEPIAVATAIAESYATERAGMPGAAISVITLDRVPELAESIDALALRLHELSSDASTRAAVRSALFLDVLDFYTVPGLLAIDLLDLSRLVAHRFPEVAAEASALGTALSGAVALTWAAAPRASAGGLSIHLVPLRADGTPAPHHADYVRGGPGTPLAFVSSSSWCPIHPAGPGLLYRLFHEPL